jgi:hypothetical protein
MILLVGCPTHGVQAPVTDPSHRSTAAGPPAASVESEYRRHGTLAYLAAYDVHHARVIGCCASTTGIAPFTALVTKVMTQQPYARRVFWIADNGASHSGWTAAARLSEQFPNAIMVHIPLHASWLNQVDLLLRRPTQTPHPRRHPQPVGPGQATSRIRDPLQRRRAALRLALHPQRPRPTPRPDRRLTPDEQQARALATDA